MLTQSEYITILEFFAKNAALLYNEEKSLHPKVLAVRISSAAPRVVTGVMPVEAQVVESIFQDTTAKSALQPIIDLILKAESPLCKQMIEAGVALPDAAVQINEAWVDNKTGAPPVHAVLVVLHHAQGTLTSFCEIEPSSGLANTDPRGGIDGEHIFWSPKVA